MGEVAIVRLEVPRVEDLANTSVEVTQSSEPGVVTVMALANDGSVVSVTWDEIACSVSIRWEHEDVVRVLLEREAVSKVSIREESGDVEFWIWSEATGLGGQLVVSVGEHVSVSDTLLRK